IVSSRNTLALSLFRRVLLVRLGFVIQFNPSTCVRVLHIVVRCARAVVCACVCGGGCDGGGWCVVYTLPPCLDPTPIVRPYPRTVGTPSPVLCTLPLPLCGTHGLWVDPLGARVNR